MYGLYGYSDTQKNMWVYIGQDKHLEKDVRDGDHNKTSNKKAQQINKVLQNDKNNRYVYKRLFFVESLKEANYWEEVLINYFKTYKYDYPEHSVFNFQKGGDNRGLPSGKDNPFYKDEIRINKQGKNKQDKMVYAIVYDTKTVCRNIDKTFLEGLVQRFNKNEISIKEIKELNREKQKEALSTRKNKSGYKNVTVSNSTRYKTGKQYRFRYYDGEKRKSIDRGSIDELEVAMNKKGFKLERV